VTRTSGAEPVPPAPERVADLVQSLATVMRQSSITELDLDLGDVSLRLRRPTPDLDGGGEMRLEHHPPASTEPDMKIMNEIAADRAGVVEAILVGNGQPVEYGSPLMRLGVGRSDRA
jgi:hypothetical protein